MSIEPDAQAHIRTDLRERLQNIDKQEAIDLYYELLSQGYSVREILSAINRACSNSERDDSETVAPPRSGSDNAATDLTSEIGLGGAAPANTQSTSDRNLPDDAEFRGSGQPQAATSDVPVPQGPQSAEHPPHNEPGTDNREQLPAGVLSESALDIAGPEDAPVSAGSKIALRSNGEGRFRPDMFPGSAKRAVFAAFCTVTIACASIAGFALLHGRRHAEPASVAIQPDISDRADAPALRAPRRRLLPAPRRPRKRRGSPQRKRRKRYPPRGRRKRTRSNRLTRPRPPPRQWSGWVRKCPPPRRPPPPRYRARTRCRRMRRG